VQLRRVLDYSCTDLSGPVHDQETISEEHAPTYTAFLLYIYPFPGAGDTGDRGTPTCPLHCTCALLGSAGSPCPSFKPSTVHINIYILYVHGSCDQLAASHCFYILYDALTPALLLVVLAVQIKPLLVNARLVAGYTRSYGLFPQS
jgi:hypothetical protein